jgi:hypothetical protein
LIVAPAFSQTDDVSETNVTSFNKVDKKKEGPKEKKLIQIIKNDTKGILYGNRCFEEVTTDMGFEYVVQPKGQPGNMNEFGRNMHNFWSKFKLFFKAGPFWKSKVNKKVRECRELSGDFVG